MPKADFGDFILTAGVAGVVTLLVISTVFLAIKSPSVEKMKKEITIEKNRQKGIVDVHNTESISQERNLGKDWARSEYSFRVEPHHHYTITCVNGTKWLLSSTGGMKQMYDTNSNIIGCD